MTESQRQSVQKYAEDRASEIENMFGGMVAETEPSVGEYYELLSAIAIGNIDEWHRYAGYWRDINPDLANEGKAFLLDEGLSSFEMDACLFISQAVARKEGTSARHY